MKHLLLTISLLFCVTANAAIFFVSTDPELPDADEGAYYDLNINNGSIRLNAYVTEEFAGELNNISDMFISYYISDSDFIINTSGVQSMSTNASAVSTTIGAEYITWDGEVSPGELASHPSSFFGGKTYELGSFYLIPLQQTTLIRVDAIALDANGSSVRGSGPSTRLTTVPIPGAFGLYLVACGGLAFVGRRRFFWATSDANQPQSKG